MGTFTGGFRVSQATQLAQASMQRETQLRIEQYERSVRGYYDQRLRMFIPVGNPNYVSAAYAQTDKKCKCCGSQETRQHNDRTICAYCRSNM